MEIQASGYGSVKAFEPHPGGHIVTNDFGGFFFGPLISVPYTTGSKKNGLLLLRGENAEMWLTLWEIIPVTVMTA